MRMASTASQQVKSETSGTHASYPWNKPGPGTRMYDAVMGDCCRHQCVFPSAPSDEIFPDEALKPKGILRPFFECFSCQKNRYPNSMSLNV